MADLTITAASVTKTSGITVNGIAGGTLTAGMPIYIDTANDNVIKAATCEGTSLQATVAGVTLHAALTGQPIAYATAGAVMNPGATVAVGSTYVLSATGLICPIADLASSDYVSYVYRATTASSVTLMCVNAGVEVP